MNVTHMHTTQLHAYKHKHATQMHTLVHVQTHAHTQIHFAYTDA